MSVQPLPSGAILLHIGPHKTGTTAIQFAAATRRATLAEAGVTYPGKISHHSPAAMAVGQRGFGWEGRGGRPPRPDTWETLVNAAHKAPDKVFISSEFFGEIEAEHIERAVRELGADRVHVVATLRPLTKILPSSWQQYLKGGSTRPLDAWLEKILADPPDPKVTPSFWKRQDHGALVERWAKVVGPDNMTVIVLDGKDHAMLPAAFEGLLGLDAGVLSPAPGQRVNRSMTAAECELIRRTNKLVTGEEVQWDEYERIVRNGAVLRMVEARKPEPGEAGIRMPHWSLVRANEIEAKAAERIAATGVRIVGDLAMLTPDPGPAPEGGDAPAEPLDAIALDAAVEAIAGAVSGAIGGGPFLESERLRAFRKERAQKVQQVAERAPTDPKIVLEDMTVRDVTSAELLSTVRRRVARRLRGSRKRS